MVLWWVTLVVAAAATKKCHPAKSDPTCASAEDTCYGNASYRICYRNVYAPEACMLSGHAWLSNAIGYVTVTYFVRDTWS